jgi:hypothetical protein
MLQTRDIAFAEILDVVLEHRNGIQEEIVFRHSREALDDLIPQHLRIQPELTLLQAYSDRADNERHNDDGDSDDEAELVVVFQTEKKLDYMIPRRAGCRGRDVRGVDCPLDDQRGPSSVRTFALEETGH